MTGTDVSNNTNTSPYNNNYSWNDVDSDVGGATLSEAEYGLEPHVEATEEEKRKDQPLQGTNRQVGGAAVAAGIAGTLLIGPVVGLVAAGGAAVMATKKGTAGNVMRASGDVVANAGDRVKKFDQKHQMSKKAGRGFVKGAKWMSKKLKVKDSNSKEGRATDLTA